MKEVWEGTAVPADGGVRARNQQRAYLERLTAREPAASAPPASRPHVRRPPVPTAFPPPPPGRQRAPWQTPERSPSRTA
jgi:RNA polymerase sigma factor FliA